MMANFLLNLCGAFMDADLKISISPMRNVTRTRNTYSLKKNEKDPLFNIMEIARLNKKLSCIHLSIFKKSFNFSNYCFLVRS
jgi:hypothetical protein